MARVILHEYCDEARESISAGAYEEAIAICRHILKRYPKHARTYKILGEACLENGDFEEATDVFKRLLEHADPENFVAHAGLGILYEEQGQIAEAIWHIERALEMAPNNEDTRNVLRRLYSKRDGTEPTRIKMNKAALARLYARGGQYRQAIDGFRALLELDSNRDRVDLQVALAETLWRDGRREQAAEIAREILQISPDCLKAILLLGVIQLEKGRDDEGWAILANARSLDPENRVAQALFGEGSPLPPLIVKIPRIKKEPPAEAVPEVPELAVPTLEEEAAAEAVTEEEAIPEEEPVAEAVPEVAVPVLPSAEEEAVAVAVPEEEAIPEEEPVAEAVLEAAEPALPAVEEEAIAVWAPEEEAVPEEEPEAEAVLEAAEPVLPAIEEEAVPEVEAEEEAIPEEEPEAEAVLEAAEPVLPAVEEEALAVWAPEQEPIPEEEPEPEAVLEAAEPVLPAIEEEAAPEVEPEEEAIPEEEPEAETVLEAAEPVLPIIEEEAAPEVEPEEEAIPEEEPDAETVLEVAEPVLPIVEEEAAPEAVPAEAESIPEEAPLASAAAITPAPLSDVERYKLQLEQKPKDDETRLALARAYRDQEQIKLALEQYSILKRAKSNLLAEVINDMESVVASRPDSLEAHELLADLYVKGGRLQQAVDRYRWVLQRLDKST